MKETDEIEIDLKELLQALKKRILIILLVTVIFAGIGGVVTEFLITPIYSSTSTLYVLSQSTSITSLADIQVGASLTKDYIAFVNTRPVINEVIENLDLDYTYEQMLDKITVSNETDTRMLKLKVEDPDPELAQKMVNAMATVVVQRIAEKMMLEEPSIIEEGYMATSPDSPDLKKNTALGALLGLLLSAGIVVIAFIMNDTVRSVEDIEQYFGITVLAAVPKDKRMAKQARKHQGPKKKEE
ncbi:MAG: YveK family protein [Lachnospiraceae bacterium]